MTNNEVQQWFDVLVGKAMPSDRATRQAAAIRAKIIAQQIEEYNIQPNPGLAQHLLNRLERQGGFAPTPEQRIFKPGESKKFFDFLGSLRLPLSILFVSISMAIGVPLLFQIQKPIVEPPIQITLSGKLKEKHELPVHSHLKHFKGPADKNKVAPTRLTTAIVRFAYSPIADKEYANRGRHADYLLGENRSSIFPDIDPPIEETIRLYALHLIKFDSSTSALRYKNLAQFAIPEPNQLGRPKSAPEHNDCNPLGHGCNDHTHPLTIRTSKLYFENNNAYLRLEQQQQLAGVATDMNAAEWLNSRFLILGNTDKRGTDESNAKLSYARALAVRQYLISKGIAADRLIPFGLGSNSPVQGSMPMDAVNRRVEIWVVED